MPLYADPAPGALSIDTPMDLSNVDMSSLPNTPLPEKRPGLLGRIQQQPGGSKALLAFGAQLLSDPNFFSGFGKGALAYQNVLDAERDKTLPQLVGKGEFMTQRDPTSGQISFNRTPIADYSDDIINRKLDSAFALGKYRADTMADTSRYGTDTRAATTREGYAHRDKWEAADNETQIRVANIQAKAAAQRASLTAAASQGKPPPAGVLRTFDEYSDKASAAEGTLSLGTNVMKTLQDGTLELGLLKNLGNKAAVVTGIGADDSSRAYGQLQQFTQALVNATLMDARGVQTDGDAERAKIMALVSAGDTQGAMAELRNAMAMIERGRDHNSARADDIANQYGVRTSATSAAASRSNAPRGAGSLRQKYGLE